jgi:hypothetical protein
MRLGGRTIRAGSWSGGLPAADFAALVGVSKHTQGNRTT